MLLGRKQENTRMVCCMMEQPVVSLLVIIYSPVLKKAPKRAIEWLLLILYNNPKSIGHLLRRVNSEVWMKSTLYIRLKFSDLTALKFVMVTSFITICVSSSLFLIRCDNMPLAGLEEKPYPSAMQSKLAGAACNTECACSGESDMTWTRPTHYSRVRLLRP